MGFLKPTWASSNIEKALKAIEKLNEKNINDQAELAGAATTAKSGFVRLAAINKLTIKEVLIHIAKQRDNIGGLMGSLPDSFKAIERLKHLNDSEALVDISKNAYEVRIREKASELIK
jgi:hypothetical protein